MDIQNCIFGIKLFIALSQFSSPPDWILVSRTFWLYDFGKHLGPWLRVFFLFSFYGWYITKFNYIQSIRHMISFARSWLLFQMYIFIVLCLSSALHYCGTLLCWYMYRVLSKCFYNKRKLLRLPDRIDLNFAIFQQSWLENL